MQAIELSGVGLFIVILPNLKNESLLSKRP
jgi:hypothetical protein